MVMSSLDHAPRSRGHPGGILRVGLYPGAGHDSTYLEQGHGLHNINLLLIFLKVILYLLGPTGCITFGYLIF